MNDSAKEVARALARDHRARLEKELAEIEAAIDALQHERRPRRWEIERQMKRRNSLMRELGLL